MDDLRVIEGSRVHRDILVLKHHWNLLAEWEVVERALRFQMELSRRLEEWTEVRLLGGPPYDRLRFAHAAAFRLAWAGESQPFRLMLTTRPSLEQAIYLVEDHAQAEQRIFEIHDGRGNAMPLLGADLASISSWWLEEKIRACNDR